MYRDHRKGPGGPPGGGRLGLETLGVGGAPPDLGGKFPPLAAAPLRLDL